MGKDHRQEPTIIESSKQLFKRHYRIGLFFLAIIGVLGILSVFLLQFEWFQNFLSEDHLDQTKLWVLSQGFVGILSFIGVVCLQVMIAPIPGQVTGLAGGYMFGPLYGTFYSMIGLIIGTSMVLVLARKFGRPFLYKLDSKDAIDDVEELIARHSKKYSSLFQKTRARASRHSLIVFFLIMLLPIFPDDLVCLVMGLTRVPLWQLIGISTLGRLPGMLTLSMVGAGIETVSPEIVNLVLFAMVGLFILGYWGFKRRKTKQGPGEGPII